MPNSMMKWGTLIWTPGEVAWSASALRIMINLMEIFLVQMDRKELSKGNTKTNNTNPVFLALSNLLAAFPIS